MVVSDQSGGVRGGLMGIADSTHLGNVLAGLACLESDLRLGVEVFSGDWVALHGCRGEVAARLEIDVGVGWNGGDV